MIRNVYVVGCGGTASYLLPVLLKTLRHQQPRNPVTLTLIDGDILEERNLDRQLFKEDQIGMNKAEALCGLHPTEGMYSQPEYFYNGMPGIEENSWFFSCVDNHVARKEILQTIDEKSGRGVFAGNEFTDEEAFYYEHRWAGKPQDPRVYYPAILTDRSDDPRSPAGCTGHEALAATPQLGIANHAAAAFAMKLFWFHAVERPKLDADFTREHWPVAYRSTKTHVELLKLGSFTMKAANNERKAA